MNHMLPMSPSTWTPGRRNQRADDVDSMTSPPTNQKNVHELTTPPTTLSSAGSPFLFSLNNFQVTPGELGSWFFGMSPPSPQDG